MTDANLHTLARQWLDAFSSAVRSNDIDAGRSLFVGHVVAFGTVQTQMHSLDQLVRDQWDKVWPNTSGFDFDPDRTHIAGDDRSILWIAAGWKSDGYDSAGQPYTRLGRATYVLQQIDGRLLCVHSHHSRIPCVSDRPLERAQT